MQAKETVPLDFTVFVVEAFATNKKIEKDISKLYDKYKYRAYKLAKNSELYNSSILCNGNIGKEVAAKRILGLMLFEDQDEETVNDAVVDLVKKGWMKLYKYIVNKKSISLQDIVNNFAYKHISTDAYFGIISIALFICHIHEIEIIQDEMYKVTCNALYALDKRHHDKKLSKAHKIEKFSYENLNREVKIKAKSIKNRLFEMYGPIKQITDIWNIFYTSDDEFMGKYVETFALLFEREDISLDSLTHHMKITNKDIEEVTALYYMLYRNQNREESAKFIVPAMYIKYLLKAYKELKDFYLKNNKETLYIEMEAYAHKVEFLESKNVDLIRENQTLKEEIKRLTNEYKLTLEKENLKLEQETETLKNQIKEHKENEKELFALRKLAFELEHNYVDDDIDFEISETANVLIVGGHENWRRKLTQALPSNFKFLDGHQESFDIQILNNIDYVFFYTAYMSHSVYYRVVNYCKNDDIEIEYIQSTSVYLVKKEISKKLNDLT